MAEHSIWQVFMHDLCELAWWVERCFYDPTWLQELLD